MMKFVSGLSASSKFFMLACAIAFQVVILAGEYLNSVYPLWIGKSVSLSVKPVDPRSLFRGNYAFLDYTIAHLDIDKLAPEIKGRLRNGVVVYVSLTEHEGEWQASGVSLTRPQQGLYIRGRYQAVWADEVRYGIEAWFAPKQKALALERDIRRTRKALAHVRIAPNGKAALVGVELVEQPGATTPGAQ